MYVSGAGMPLMNGQIIVFTEEEAIVHIVIIVLLFIVNINMLTGICLLLVSVFAVVFN